MKLLNNRLGKFTDFAVLQPLDSIPHLHFGDLSLKGKVIQG